MGRKWKSYMFSLCELTSLLKSPLNPILLTVVSGICRFFLFSFEEQKDVLSSISHLVWARTKPTFRAADIRSCFVLFWVTNNGPSESVIAWGKYPSDSTKSSPSNASSPKKTFVPEAVFPGSRQGGRVWEWDQGHGLLQTLTIANFPDSPWGESQTPCILVRVYVSLSFITLWGNINKFYVSVSFGTWTFCWAPRRTIAPKTKRSVS